jgi:DNA-binding Xre family transcriptional regulator
LKTDRRDRANAPIITRFHACKRPSRQPILPAPLQQTSDMGNKRKASPEILRVLATNLKRLRDARGYTQQELAQRCGFPNSYIGDVEQETVNITLANLEALANGLECDVVDLVRTPSERFSQDP